MVLPDPLFDEFLAQSELEGVFHFFFTDAEGKIQEGTHTFSPILKKFISSFQPFTIHFEGKDCRNILWDNEAHILRTYSAEGLKRRLQKGIREKEKKQTVKHVREKPDYSKQPRAWILYHHNGPKK